jgi:hypothetical protein
MQTEILLPAEEATELVEVLSKPKKIGVDSPTAPWLLSGAEVLRRRARIKLSGSIV